MKRGLLVVVATERHVERLAKEGVRAETRTSLFERLRTLLLPDVAVVDARDARLVLGAVLARDEPTERAPQLGLFERSPRTEPAAKARAAKKQASDLLATVRALGGASFARTVFAVDDALAILRAAGVDAARLDRLAASRAAPSILARASMLATAMRRLDDALRERGLVDARCAPMLVADAVRAASPEAVAEALGATAIETRFVLGWDAADLAVIRAIDEKLGATLVLPVFERPLDPTRDRDPLDQLTEAVARGLDGAPHGEPIAMRLGDLASAPPASVDGLRVVHAPDPAAQAAAVVRLVGAALRAGTPVERVAVAGTFLDERSLVPLRQAFDDAGIVAFESRGAPPSASPVVVAVLAALRAVESPDRATVARVLRSGYVDPLRLAPAGASFRDAELALGAAARALETTATVAGPDAFTRLSATVVASTTDERARGVVQVFARVLARARGAVTRRQRVAAVRGLVADLGVAARAGRGALDVFASDEAPRGVPKLERLAIARDARAFETFLAAVDLCERAAMHARALDDAVAADVFRLELEDALDRRSARPFGGSAGAVRILRIDEVAAEPLELLVILDANEGALPRDVAGDTICTDAFLGALEARGASLRVRDLASLAVAAHHARTVVLVHVAEDAQGAPLAPSFVVEALERAGVAAETEPPSRASTASVAPLAAASVALRALREREREAFFLDPARPRSAVVGDLSPAMPEAARALVEESTGAGERAFAVTSLERFARCAFQGLAHVVYAAREVEAREDVPDAREEGILVHDALAAAFTATASLWAVRPRDAEAIVARGLAATERVLALNEGHAPLRAIVRLRVHDAVRAVLRVAIADEEWDFTAAEQAFGMRSKGAAPWPAFIIERAGARVRLRGSIDRVDRAHDGRSGRVIDYKRTESTVKSAGSGLGETAIQVPLYARVAAGALGVPTTGRYFAAQARDVDAKPSAKVQAKMDELVTPSGDEEGALAPVEALALELVVGARAGRLAPLPPDPTVCRTCAVSGGCRKPRFAMAAADDVDES